MSRNLKETDDLKGQWKGRRGDLIKIVEKLKDGSWTGFTGNVTLLFDKNGNCKNDPVFDLMTKYPDLSDYVIGGEEMKLDRNEERMLALAAVIRKLMRELKVKKYRINFPQEDQSLAGMEIEIEPAFIEVRILEN